MEGGSPTSAVAGGALVTVTVLNETDDTIDVARWSALVQQVLASEGVRGPAETNVVFVDRDAMTELNAEHMGGTGATDVLSFPIDDEPDEFPLPAAAGAGGGPSAIRFVGDIVVCPSVAAENAPGHAGTLDDEIALLLVHASLHLLGHDHGEPVERDAMWAAEQRLLDHLWSPLSRNPWSEQ